MKPLAWGRLLRLSLAPSAAADIAAGLCLGAWGVLPARRESLLLVLSSLCVYHGGMALNDWADRERDARTRPDRPIPSGAVSPTAALWVAVLLLLLGPVLAALAEPRLGLWMAGIAALASYYDLAGRGAWRGPILLASCRGLNLGAGVWLGALMAAEVPARAPRAAWPACLLYAAYVFFASRLARLEDDEDSRGLGRRPAVYLLGAAACLAVQPAIVLFMGVGPAPADSGDEGFILMGSLGLLAFLGVVGLVTAGTMLGGLRRAAWTREQVGAATGRALRRLLVFTAMCALASILFVDSWSLGIRGPNGAHVGILILLGYPLSFALRKVFPPT